MKNKLQEAFWNDPKVDLINEKPINVFSFVFMLVMTGLIGLALKPIGTVYIVFIVLAFLVMGFNLLHHLFKNKKQKEEVKKWKK